MYESTGKVLQHYKYACSEHNIYLAEYIFDHINPFNMQETRAKSGKELRKGTAWGNTGYPTKVSSMVEVSGFYLIGNLLTGEFFWFHGREL